MTQSQFTKSSFFFPRTFVGGKEKLIEKSALRAPRQRKAQITVFIIIAILLLFSTALILYTRSRVIEGIAEREIVEEVPIEFEPVRSYIENCIEQKAIEALDAIGRHGGYINPAEWGFNQFSEFAPTDSPANSLYAFGNVIPYWWYLKGSNKCQSECEVGALIPHLYRDQANPQSLVNAAPEALSIEIQLDDYINRNLKKCTGDFYGLKQMDFDIKELGKVETTTTVAEENVIFDVNYPLEIKKGEAIKRMTRHRLTIPLNLKRIYEEANKILETEKSTWFLEMHTLNLITSFEDFEKLPFQSYSYTSMAPSPIWTEWETKQLVEAMLTTYVPALQIPGSKNYQFMYAFDDFGLYTTHTDVPMIGNENLEARIEYLAWPAYIDLGAEGQVVKCEFAGITFPIPLGVVRCETPYDLSYPVAITLEDPSAFNNKGYTFRFALEACIRNNEPCGLTYREVKYNPVPAATQFCDLNQRTADCDDCSDVEFLVKDRITDEELEDSVVTYLCGEDACILGETDAAGKLQARLPPCLQAIAGFKKTSPYLEEFELLETVGGQEIDVTKRLWPYTDVSITVKKKEKIKICVGAPPYDHECSWKPGLSQAKDLEQGTENATIILRRVNNLLEGNFPQTSLVIDGAYPDRYETVTLVPGKYEVTIQLFRTDPLWIPPDGRKEKGGWGPFKEEEFYWAPETPIYLSKDGEKFPSGGSLFNENSGYIEITREMLEKGKITFYAISHNLYDYIGTQYMIDRGDRDEDHPAIVIEDLDYILFDLEAFTKRYGGYLKPTAE